MAAESGEVKQSFRPGLVELVVVARMLLILRFTVDFGEGRLVVQFTVAAW